MANLLFYLMAVGAVVSSLVVVSARNPVVSVLSLLCSFVCLATIYLLAGFQFMAAAQLLVYAGAIMVLFLFVIMLLNLAGPDAERGPVDRAVLRARRLPLVASIAAAVALMTLFAIQTQETVLAADPELAERGVSTFAGLAELMFSTYLLPFEAASVLLLSATIAVIVLAKRQRGEVTRETRLPEHAAPTTPQGSPQGAVPGTAAAAPSPTEAQAQPAGAAATESAS